ncbi:MAG: polymerase primary sigma factor, partial [Actinomycetota bacterium]|nr:polymerase primary sigma factor [Actinomycetota bacterium]
MAAADSASRRRASTATAEQPSGLAVVGTEDAEAPAPAQAKTATKSGGRAAKGGAATKSGAPAKTAKKAPAKKAGSADTPAEGGEAEPDAPEGELEEAAPAAEDLTDEVEALGAEVVEAADVETEEPTEEDKKSGDFVWDEEESEALRQARKDAELTASADSVRAYLKQIGKVALLNAEEEVELAKRI